MALITSSIPNLVNGVSQQPPTLRLASQAEEQTNFLSSVADGLTRRPPSRHLAKLSNDAWASAFLHTINLDTSERYIMAILGGQIKVFEASTGAERVVNAPNGWGYLSDARESYRAVTVADFTFIVNRTRVAQMAATTSPMRTNQALVNIRGGNYAKTFRIFLNGSQIAEYTTPRGDDPSHVEFIKTTAIGFQLMESIAASTSPAKNGYTFVRNGDLIIITRTTGDAPFSVRVEDDAGGTLMVAIHGTVQRFSDLPTRAPNGFVAEVVGDQSSGFDNYHVRFETPTGGGEQTGVWKETLKGGEVFRLNKGTMPHVLVREANGTFTFKQADWAEREAGDLKKIPNPSFVGRPIRDIFFFRNRLGVVADENVIMSQSGEFFDFWRDTATTVLDTDPIDIAVTSTQVSLLNYALPFNQSLILFSDQSQFILDGGDILTAQTASVNQATSFESAASVRPVGVGPFIYFPVPRGSFSGMREYFVLEGGSSQNDALDVTAHVPRYLPREINAMAVSTSEDIMVVQSRTAPNTLWVYKYFSNNEGKLQSAWSKWEFLPLDYILYVSFIESKLVMIVQRLDGTYLETINIESGASDANVDFQYCMDRGIFGSQTVRTYDPATDTTTLTLPYASPAPLWVIIHAGATVNVPGTALPHTRPSNNTVLLQGDHRVTSLFLGVRYTSRYEFSTFYMRGPEAGGGTSTNVDGRLQVRYLSLDYNRTGYFKVISQPTGRGASIKTFTGSILGVASGVIGKMSLWQGRFRVPIMSRNTEAKITIESDHWLPCAFTSAEWEATFNTRARKV